MLLNIEELLLGDMVTFQGYGFMLEAVIAMPGDQPTVSQMYNRSGDYADVSWVGFLSKLDEGGTLQGPLFYGTGQEALLFRWLSASENLSIGRSEPITNFEVVREHRIIHQWSL